MMLRRFGTETEKGGEEQDVDIHLVRPKFEQSYILRTKGMKSLTEVGIVFCLSKVPRYALIDVHSLSCRPIPRCLCL